MGATSRRRGGFSLRVEEDSWGNEDRSWTDQMKGYDSCLSGTLDVSTFSAAHLAEKGAIPSGVALQKLSTGLWGAYQGAAGVNETQTFTRTSTAGTVDYTFVYEGETYRVEDVPASAAGFTAAAHQTAFEALDIVDIDDIVFTGSAGGPLTATYSGGKFAGMDVALVAADNAAATGGTVVVSAGIAGVSGGAGLLFTTTSVGDDTATAEDVGIAIYWEGVVDTNKLPTFEGTNVGEVDADFRRAVPTIMWRN